MTLETHSAKPEHLSKLLARHFNEDELRALCTDLAIDYENLGGKTPSSNARELVFYCQRRGRLHELIRLCIQERPNTNWLIFSEAPVNIEQEVSAPFKKTNITFIAIAAVAIVIIIGVITLGLNRMQSVLGTSVVETPNTLAQSTQSTPVPPTPVPPTPVPPTLTPAPTVVPGYFIDRFDTKVGDEWALVERGLAIDSGNLTGTSGTLFHEYQKGKYKLRVSINGGNYKIWLLAHVENGSIIQGYNLQCHLDNAINRCIWEYINRGKREKLAEQFIISSGLHNIVFDVDGKSITATFEDGSIRSILDDRITEGGFALTAFGTGYCPPNYACLANIGPAYFDEAEFTPIE